MSGSNVEKLYQELISKSHIQAIVDITQECNSRTICNEDENVDDSESPH